MYYQLKDLGEIITGNTPSKNDLSYYNSEDIPFIKPDVFTENNITINTPSDYLSEKAREKARIVNKGSLLVTCIGSIGKIGICQNECAFNQQINAIIPNNKVNVYYLAYNLLFNKRKLLDIANAPVVPIINKKQFGEFSIKIDSNLTQQHRIVAILDQVNDLISLRNQQLEQLDLLVKSRFVEMFGDTKKNIQSYPIKKLVEVSDIVSGITKGRKTKNKELFEVPYMAVSNVKDGYIDWTKVKTIMATQEEIDKYRLLPNDILMTEGGDPDKVGRGSIIEKPLNNCIHQNHIFRVRLNTNLVLPNFFAEFLRQPVTKMYFLSCAKQTTGIASINMKQLSAMLVLLPPLALQNQFADFVTEVEKQKSTVKQSLEQLETLKQKLMQDYFG